MPDFHVFWDTVVRRVRIHRSDCGACNNSAGMNSFALQGESSAGSGKPGLTATSQYPSPVTADPSP